MTTIRTLFPAFNNDRGVSYTCNSICEHLHSEDVEVQTWYAGSDDGAHGQYVRNACPRLLLPLVYRLPNAGGRLARAAERRFVSALRRDDIAYLWPGVSLETYQRIKDRGNVIVVERINCHTGFAKRILDAEYTRIGWPTSHDLTDEDVETENQQLALADFIFAPNPFVVRSLRETGIAPKKILPVSYGWSPQRFTGNSRAIDEADGLDVLFAGRLCVRKGIHLLLEAWEKARIKGRLLLSGAVHHDVAARLADALNRPNVVQLGHRLDLGAVYRAADVFVFGTLEEGGPMVTYEAMGCGLPVIVSPMGAGPARDGVDGFVRQPHDIDDWVAALRQLADDSELRQRMGRSARARADEFTWEKVALRRRTSLLQALDREIPQALVCAD